MAKKEEKKETQPTEKKGFLSKLGNAVKQLTSASMGAGVGALIGFLLPIPGGTLAGAAVGGLIGRGVEAGINYALDNNKIDENASISQDTAAIIQDQTKTVTPTNTAKMTAALGGPKPVKQAKEDLTESPIAAPKPHPGAAKIQAATALGAAAKPLPELEAGSRTPTAASIFNPAGTPTLRPSAASAA